MHPNKPEFLKLAAQGNVIPVYEEFLADTETPVSAFLKISKNEPYAFLLESVEGEEKIARYSFVGIRPRYVWKSRGRHFEKIQGKKIVGGQMNDPFYEIEKLLKGYRFIPSADLPRFQGGLVGYLAYDLVRFCERIPDKNPDPWGLPETYLMLADQMVVFDHAQHKIRVVANAFIEGIPAARAYQLAIGKIKELIQLLKKSEMVEAHCNVP
ncbi:MAG: anthranilate synthase component I, partial [Candidatus Omnitrophica bacterium]|nr:anthranilate synthase component I [Candidatus Omnitrophota bacterium]